MGHAEIRFLIISAIDDFTNFFQRYRNLSMALLLVTHTGIGFLHATDLLRHQESQIKMQFLKVASNFFLEKNLVF